MPTDRTVSSSLHGFFVTHDGTWTAVQQSMNGEACEVLSTNRAALSTGTGPFSEIIDLTDHRAEKSRGAQIGLLSELGPNGIIHEYAALSNQAAAQPELLHLVMPAHHDVRLSDVFNTAPARHAAEVVHGAPFRFRDPTRCSAAVSIRPTAHRTGDGVSEAPSAGGRFCLAHSGPRWQFDRGTPCGPETSLGEVLCLGSES